MLHRSWLFFVGVVFCGAWIARADTFTGKYSNDKLNIEIVSAGGDDYSGTIQMGDKQFPMTGHAIGTELSGQFTSGGNSFPFTADLSDAGLKLSTGGATYVLTRPADSANPVAANPLAQASAPAASDAGKDVYTVLASNDSGQTIFAQKPHVSSMQDAVQWALDDLSKHLDARPTIVKAYADSKDQHQGFVSFTGKLKGVDVKGSMLIGIGDNGASVSMVYARTDASTADATALINAVPTDAKWSDYELPDNTGTIRIADGWQVTTATQIGTVRIAGPANQIIDLGDGVEVVTPDSMAAQIMAQSQAQARMMGGPPPPASSLFVAPFTGPVDALKNLVPQLSQQLQAAGQPGITLDKIIDSVPVQAMLPNGQAARIIYSWTKGDGDSAQHFRTFCQMETYPVIQGSWGACFSEVTAPDSTFDHDLPLMLQTANSLKLNAQAVQQHTDQAIAASNQRFASFESAMKEKNDAFDSYMKSTENNELINERSNADFDEVIRGYRTVEDTETGNRTSVDLGNVDQIVDGLNQGDPGRYVEIPLRDEMYPKPAGQ
jgi:hypothetical protein